MKKSDIQPYVWQGRRIDAGIPIANRVAPIFRRIFEVTKDVTEARIAICGLGLFELRINGELPDAGENGFGLGHEIVDRIRPGPIRSSAWTAFFGEMSTSFPGLISTANSTPEFTFGNSLINQKT